MAVAARRGEAANDAGTPGVAGGLSAPPPGETAPVSTGHELIVHRPDDGNGLIEQLSRMFYRLSWRTPIHGLRLQGKHPLRLLAAPADPLPADKAAGMAIRAGYFSFRGEKIPFAALSEAKSTLNPDALAYLHRFDWLRDLDAAAGVEGARAIAEPLVAAWLARHDRTVGEPVWRADIAAWRMLTMMAHAPAILASRDLVYRSKVLNDLARTARHLDRSAGRTRPGAARVIAWAGVVGAGLLLPDGQARRVVGEAQLQLALDGAVYPDGGIVSRSPIVLADCIAMLSLLGAAYAARREATPAFIGDALGRMVPALTGLIHGDGGLSAWQGAPPVAAERMRALVAASGVRARPLRQSRDWGYQRLSAAKTVIIVDTAPPPLADQCDAGCASTLAFEMSHAGERIVINCGGGAMRGGQVSAEIARGLRSTAAHSALVVADTNSTAILSGGRLGHGVNSVDLDRQESEAGVRIDAMHDGYAKSFGLSHRRALTLRHDGTELRGEDVLLPVSGGRRRGTLPVAVRFHLGPTVVPELEGGMAGARSALMRLADGDLWRLTASIGRLAIEDSLWVDAEGRLRPTQQLVIQFDTQPGGTGLSWSIGRAG